MKNFILIGLPASGKGTQAASIVTKYSSIKLLSIGNLLRNEVENSTELGLLIQDCLSSGTLVNDIYINNLVKKYLTKEKSEAFLYDGYPRTIAQAIFLKDLLIKQYTVKATVVFYMNISPEIAIDRISGRLSCKDCSIVFNLRFKPPKQDGICDICGSKLFIRADDARHIVEKRVIESQSNNNLLLDFYNSSGVKIIEIDATINIENIFNVLKDNINFFL